MFDKEAFFKFDDVKIEKVECPEWGDFGKQIYIRTMSGRARDTYETGIYNSKKDDSESFLYNMRASLVVACCCDKEGKLHFEPEDVDKLGEMSGAVLDRLYDKSKGMSKMSDEDVEEMEKSLESDRG